MKETKNIIYPKLCGGVFFSILQSYITNHVPASLYFNGVKDPKSNIPTLISLICVIDPDFKNSLPQFSSIKKYTSEYINCRHETPKGLAVNTIPYLAKLRHQMSGNYPSLLWRMHTFLDETVCLHNAEGKERIPELTQLVREIIEIINHDTSLKNVKFPIGPNGESMPIDMSSTIHFQAFMLGIWSYIIENHIDNVVDMNTMDEWKALKDRGSTVNSPKIVIMELNEPEIVNSEHDGALDNYDNMIKHITDAEEIPRNGHLNEDTGSDDSADSSHHCQSYFENRSLVQTFNNYGSGPQIANNTGTIIIGKK